jgi:hypothetical protein
MNRFKKVLLIIALSLFICTNIDTNANLNSKNNSKSNWFKQKTHKSLAYRINSRLIKKIKCIDYVTIQSLLYAQKLGGVRYNEKIDAFVPISTETFQNHLHKHKEQIAKAIGTIYPLDDETTKAWVNSAKNMEELLIDAQLASEIVKDISLDTASDVKAVFVSFGKDKSCLIKKESSIYEKMRRYSRLLSIPVEDVLPIVNDSVRGSIITDNIHNLLQAVGVFRAKAESQGIKVAFKNLWQRTQGAYGSIHAKLYIPLTNKNSNETRYVLGEIQFHLRAIFNGSSQSPKEKQHILYEKIRNLNADTTADTTLAGDLIYAPHICEIAHILSLRVKLSRKEREIISFATKDIAIKAFSKIF